MVSSTCGKKTVGDVTTPNKSCSAALAPLECCVKYQRLRGNVLKEGQNLKKKSNYWHPELGTAAQCKRKLTRRCEGSEYLRNIFANGWSLSHQHFPIICCLPSLWNTALLFSCASLMQTRLGYDETLIVSHHLHGFWRCYLDAFIILSFNQFLACYIPGQYGMLFSFAHASPNGSLTWFR
jgi:hypothetical protein